MEEKKINTLFESVYDHLRNDIVNGNLSPDSKLRIEDLRARYKTSASPLREALNRLSGEGYVESIGQRGFKVSPTSIENLMDITRMRIKLECDALTESIKVGDDEWEANILASYHKLSKAESLIISNFNEWEILNDEFHESLIAACTSPLLKRFRHTLYELHKRYRMVSVLSKDSMRNVHLEHEAIKNAAIARDIKLACIETTKHIKQTAEIYSSSLAKEDKTSQM